MGGGFLPIHQGLFVGAIRSHRICIYRKRLINPECRIWIPKVSGVYVSLVSFILFRSHFGTYSESNEICSLASLESRPPSHITRASMRSPG